MRFFATILFLFSFCALSQDPTLPLDEDRLKVLLEQLRASKNDQEKAKNNALLKEAMSVTLAKSGALSYPFSSLKTIGFIDSPDGKFRIVNWNVEQDDFSQKYTCFVLHKHPRKKEHYVTELKKSPMAMPMWQPKEILTSDNWYGALYYKIIPVKKGGKTLYTVLGWDYYSSMSQLRIIDVMYASGKDIKLGNPIFKVAKETHKRMIYEHSKKTMMNLKYEANRGRIMMDHLSPESPSMKNFKAFYVPDMSYDAFTLEGSKWVLKEDVIGTNNGGTGGKQTVYVYNEKTGEIEARTLKTKWINPENPNAPISNGSHVAVTPETEDNQNTPKLKIERNKDDSDPKENNQKLKTQNTNQEPVLNKKDKRDPSNISFYKEMKKKRRKGKGKRKKP